VVLITPKKHPWVDTGPISPQQLIGQQFILGEATSGTTRVMQTGLLEHDIRLDDLDVVMELGSAEAIVTAVEAGIGLAFISRVVASRCIAAGHIAEAPVEGLDLVRQLHLVRHSRRAQTRVQAAFWDFVHMPENKVFLEKVARGNNLPTDFINAADLSS
jgi:DNA-binding transcriptional LysR family regulator